MHNSGQHDGQGPRRIERQDGTPILLTIKPEHREAAVNFGPATYVDQWNAGGYEHPLARQAAAVGVTIGKLGRMISRGSKRLKNRNAAGRPVYRLQLVPDGNRKTRSGKQKMKLITHYKHSS